jgi:hypothetical protein
MATGFSISVGYISGHTTTISQDNAWEVLKHTAQELATMPNKFVGETLRASSASYLTLKPYGGIYTASIGCPIQFDDDRHQIFISASGDNPARALKEQTAMGFIRSLMLLMNKAGIPLNISVT